MRGTQERGTESPAPPTEAATITSSTLAAYAGVRGSQTPALFENGPVEIKTRPRRLDFESPEAGIIFSADPECGSGVVYFFGCSVAGMPPRAPFPDQLGRR